MATVPAPAKAASFSKYDAQVAAQLTKAEQRVRFLDLVTGLLGLLALSLVFALVMVLIHWKLDLSTGARRIALVVYLLGAGAYLTWKVILPLRRPINPRYAALQLEHILPGSKNSVVNYIDLRGEELPAAIRGALSRRAAKDAVQADVDQAISSKQAGRAGGIAAGVAALCIALMFAVGFRDFFRLLGGVFVPRSPVSTVSVVQQNRIVIRQPQGGNTTVAAGSAISFAVRVEGDLPPGDAQNPKLILTYPQSNDTVVRHMVRPRRAGGDWTADVSALEIRDGFTYKVTAGDAESAEYHVGVFFTPAVTNFKAVYTFPLYVGEPRLKVQTVNRRLQAWRGTEVSLRVQTNDTVKDAQIETTGKDGIRKTIDATIAADDREAFEARFVLQETGTYRLRFTSAHDEKYLDPLAYELIADLDLPPHKVELTKPGADIHLPANGLLKVEGTAEDDIGVKSLTLQVQIVDGPKLKAKAYRSDEELRLPGGGYLKTLAYKDAVDLKTVQGADGKPAALKAGMKLEYWLEARDACTYPRPKEIGDIGASKHFFVTLTEPEADAQKQQKDRDDAKKEQDKHQTKQDEQKKQEDQNRKEQQKQAEAEKNQSKAGNDEKSQPKPDDKHQGKKSDEGKPENKRDADQQNAKNELDKKSEENERRAEEQGQSGKPDQKEQPKNDKGQHKDDGKAGQQKPAESKPADPKQGGNQAEPQNKKGEGKPESKNSDKKQGECKSCNNPGGQGQGKSEGKNETMAGGQKGDSKGASASGNPMTGQGGQKPGEAKNDTPSKPHEDASGAAKGGNTKQGESQAAKAKPGSASSPEKDQAQGKDVGETGKVADNKPTGAGKDQQPDKGGSTQAQAKDNGTNPDTGNESQAKGADAKSGTQGEKKPGPQQATGQETARSKPEKRQDAGGDVSKIDAKKPSGQDLNNLKKALENGDSEQVSKAQKKLEEIGDQAQDPNTRESAKDLADKLKKYVEESQKQEREAAAAAKPGTKPDQGPEEQVAAKNKPGDNPNEAGKSKEGKGEPQNKPGTEKGEGRKEHPGNPMTPNGMGEKDDPTKATVKGPMNPLGRRPDSEEARNPEEEPKPGKAVNPLTQPDTLLQLEHFDRRKYLDRENALTSKAPHKETKPTPGTTSAEKLNPSTGGNLPNLTGRNTDPKTTSTNPFDAGRAPPPPGYGSAASKFTRILADPEKK